MREVWIFWCEYDLGQEGLIFTSLAVAEKNAKQMAEDQSLDFDELVENDLLGFEPVRMIDE